jgi:hypothetical protein
MNAQIEEQAVAVAVAPEPAPRTNQGWFQAGDERINRQGRPRGSKASVPEGTHPADCAPRADRLVRLVVDERDLAWRLASIKAPCVANLPPDFQVVACRFDDEVRGRGPRQPSSGKVRTTGSAAARGSSTTGTAGNSLTNQRPRSRRSRSGVVCVSALPGFSQPTEERGELALPRLLDG